MTALFIVGAAVAVLIVIFLVVLRIGDPPDETGHFQRVEGVMARWSDPSNVNTNLTVVPAADPLQPSGDVMVLDEDEESARPLSPREPRGVPGRQVRPAAPKQSAPAADPAGADRPMPISSAPPRVLSTKPRPVGSEPMGQRPRVDFDGDLPVGLAGDMFEPAVPPEAEERDAEVEAEAFASLDDEPAPLATEPLQPSANAETIIIRSGVLPEEARPEPESEPAVEPDEPAVVADAPTEQIALVPDEEDAEAEDPPIDPLADTLDEIPPIEENPKN